MKNLTMSLFLFFTLGSEKLLSYHTTEHLWTFDSRSFSEFSDMEEYVRFKMKESDAICRLPMLKDDSLTTATFRYYYFSGKAKAYEDCLKTMM